ncbi:hypothetical protein KCU65_g79, partial [Aureobasidium melanogenum]
MQGVGVGTADAADAICAEPVLRTINVRTSTSTDVARAQTRLRVRIICTPCTCEALLLYSEDGRLPVWCDQSSGCRSLNPRLVSRGVCDDCTASYSYCADKT